MKPDSIYTVGHSNHDQAALIALLERHGVRQLVDVRAFPRSRRNPQFDRAALGGALGAVDILYRWRGDALGGFRKPVATSPHTALTDAAFRGFADYMDTPEFARAFDALCELAAARPTAVMCAEADPAHCHRQFLSDRLRVAGVEVRHILPDGAVLPHRLNACLDAAAEPPVYNRHEQGDLFAP
ncbi:MAG: DUF488 domain-containing protein [Gammaproteobacteria bacterium]